ncbi:MAG TPA: DUF1080 domain-containing protein [Planctomycetota bacterium]|nr:DUF1080 domain-containing protein [Planctomycetota bacterium]
MKIFRAGVLALLCSCAAPPDAPEAGWTSLFNGKDLEGWAQNGSAVWKVEDGVIAGGQDGDPKRAGTLATKAMYQDFELSLEFLIDEHGKYNSGIYIRNDVGSTGQATYQINIGRGAAGEFCGGVVIRKNKGIEWLSKGDEKDEIRKPRAWNSMRVLAQGAHLVVNLNGVTIVDVVDPAPPARNLQKGVISFQTYGAEGHAGFVKFRNLKIREL